MGKSTRSPAPAGSSVEPMEFGISRRAGAPSPVAEKKQKIGGRSANEPISEAELLAYCRERLADFKRPKQIHITDAIPRTATGKIQRRLVAQAYSNAS